MRPRIDASLEASARLFGIPIVTSPYVPKVERYEVDYSRPLVVRLCHGRTVDIRTWEEDQIFLLRRKPLLSHPETWAGAWPWIRGIR